MRSGITSILLRAIEKLATASRGTYRPPTQAVAQVERAFGATKGLDTSAIRSAAQLVRGSSQSETAAGISEVITGVLIDVAVGLIGDALQGLISDWFGASDDAEAAGKEAEAATSAVNEINDSATNQCHMVEDRAAAHIDMLATILSSIDPAENPEGFAQLVSLGAGVVDESLSTMADICGERDQAIAASYGKLVDVVETLAESNAHRVTPHPVSETLAAGATKTMAATVDVLGTVKQTVVGIGDDVDRLVDFVTGRDDDASAEKPPRVATDSNGGQSVTATNAPGDQCQPSKPTVLKDIPPVTATKNEPTAPPVVGNKPMASVQSPNPQAPLPQPVASQPIRTDSVRNAGGW